MRPRPSPSGPRRRRPRSNGWRLAAVTAILLAAAAARLGPAPDLAAYCVLFAGLVAVSVVDIRVGLVPRRSSTRPSP